MLQLSGLEPILLEHFQLPPHIRGAEEHTHWVIYGDSGTCWDKDGVACGSPRLILDVWLLFVPGYHPSRVVIPPFHSPLGYMHVAPDERRFNILMSKGRVSVEHGFGYVALSRSLRCLGSAQLFATLASCAVLRAAGGQRVSCGQPSASTLTPPALQGPVLPVEDAAAEDRASCSCIAGQCDVHRGIGLMQCADLRPWREPGVRLLPA